MQPIDTVANERETEFTSRPLEKPVFNWLGSARHSSATNPRDFVSTVFRVLDTFKPLDVLSRRTTIARMPTPPAPIDRSPAPTALDSQALREQLDMLAALGTSLHQVGLSAHRLEDALDRAAALRGTPLQVFSLPTGLMLCVDAEPSPVTLLFASVLAQCTWSN